MASTQPRLTRFYFLLGAVALVGAAVLVYQARRPAAVSIPANVTVLEADTAGFRGYLLGSDTAPVEVSEYADYQCPACRDFETVQFPTVVEQLIRTGRVRWRYRDYPLPQHRHSRVASHAAACADDQGKFWELHTRIYRTQDDWINASRAAAFFRRHAGELGMDLGEYDRCMESAKYAGRIQASLEEGARLGVSSTPTLLIGDRLYPGVLPSDSLKKLVDALQSAPPAGR